MPTELERKIAERIGRSGPITFRDFMQSALYDEDLGYYNTQRPKIGAGGDYYTSSNVHRAMGAVIARAITEQWRTDGGPLTIVEMGAGTGQMAEDILTATLERHTSSEQLSYVIVEVSPAMRGLQQERLKQFGDRVRWQSLEDIARSPIAGVFFSNELVDAMPVHRVRAVARSSGFKGLIEEQYVTLDDVSDQPRLALEWRSPSSEKLAAYIRRCGANLDEGRVAEINLDAVAWLARVASAIERGYLITIDYGDVAAHLYGPDRREGTLRSFRSHRLVESPLERVGEQDITASVNFTALVEYGRDAGLEAVSYERQSAFLLRNGLIDIIAEMEEATGSIDDMKERLAIKNLFLPGGVSDNFRVLIQRKT
jgi:SAM-dependent MidA family methyltransferase